MNKIDQLEYLRDLHYIDTADQDVFCGLIKFKDSQAYYTIFVKDETDSLRIKIKQQALDGRWGSISPPKITKKIAIDTV